ncbi:hypothetical protein ACQEVF_13310 [Nonomuraea polychroma]|uniref:hypothetical protein n=1 Tax=Nonomuraea polychroma TaxID=46176 RepID=UPI003D91D417
MAAFAGCGAMDFAYGQGSVFTGFTTLSDLDIVIIRSESEPPPPGRRPVERLSEPGSAPTQFHDLTFGLDKMRVSGWEVDVVHYTRTRFDSWCTLVKAGDGWQEEEWPQPLHTAAGFVHGTLLVDGERVGHAIRESIRTPPPQLITKSTAALEQQLPTYRDALLDCADRGDEWLFHQLAAQLVKQIYITWFALEGHYLPFPKRLRQWIQHLGLNEQGARLERRIWETVSLYERRLAIVRFADYVLASNAANSAV